MEANRPQSKPPRSLVARLLTLVKRLLVVAVLAALAALAGKYYWFDRLDEEIRARIELQLRAHYPQLAVSVRSARRVAGKGVEIRGVKISANGQNQQPLLEIDEIFADCDTRLPDFVTQPPRPKSVRINRLKLRAERSASGDWELARLLPLPQCSSATLPAITVKDASLEIIDATQSPPCAWTLRNIQLSVSPKPQPASNQPASNHSSNKAPLQIKGSAAGDYLEQVTVAGALDPASGTWNLKGVVEGLEFSPRLRAALPRELGQSLAPLASVRGRTHFQFQASSSEAGARPAPVKFSIDGQISEGRIDDERLPEPLTDVAARLHCDNQGIAIDELSARCGETHVSLAWPRIRGYQPGSPCQLTLNVRRLMIDRLQVAALPAEAQEVFQRFSPRGTIDLTGKLDFDGRQWIPDFTLRCHDLSLQYDRYPYRVTNGTGTIRVQPDFVSVRLRTLGSGGRIIQCRADVRQPGPHFTGWVEVQSEGPLPIDDRLIAALDPAVQRVVRAFHPRGSASFQGRLERDPGEPNYHRKLSVQLEDCSVQHDRFRYPIDKVTGTLELTDDDWLFRNLAGRNDSAYIVGEGSWEKPARLNASEAPQHLLRLKFTATDVPLADELRQAVSPESQRLWTNLRPRGNIDHLTVGLKYDGRATSLEIDAQKWPPGQNVEGRSLSIEPACFRYRLDNLTGTFRYHDGAMQFSNVTANHGRTSISTEGVGNVLADGSSRLELSRFAADQIELDQDLAAAMPGRMSQALSRLSLEGTLNLLGRLGITVPATADTAPAVDWDLSLDVESGRLPTTLPIEHLQGGVRLVGGTGPQGMATRGELTVDSAIIRDVQLTNIRGPFWTDGERLVFGSPAEAAMPGRVPRSLTAQVFSGEVAADGELSLLPGGSFQVRTVLDDGKLAEIARQLAPRQRGLTGRVFGQASITGTSAGVHTWRGDGQVRFRDADIYEVPVMLALVKLLSVQRADRTAFTTSELDFRIEGDDLALDRIDFSGDAFSLKGKGRINLQRQVSLKFYPVMGREEQHIPIFRPLLGETGRQFMLIEVTGTLDKPDVDRTVFPKLDDRLRELFPELAREELVEPAMPILTAPREALDRLRLIPRR